MKKFYVLLLCIALILGLAALFSDANFQPPPATQPPTAPTAKPTNPPTVPPTVPPTSAPTQPNLTEPSTLPPETDPLVQSLPMNAIILTEQNDIWEDAAGNPLFTYTYPNVMLILEHQEMVDTVTLDLLNRIDSSWTIAEQLLNSAQSAGAFGPYWLKIQFDPQRIDRGILSLSGQQISYSGGNHPNITSISVTYDLAKGMALSLEDVLAEGITADMICRLVVDALAEQEKDAFLFDDYSATVENRFSGDMNEDGDWYLSNDGLCFTFSPYEIAPYASGIVTAVVPYSRLLGILEDTYFPAEQIMADGQMDAVLLNQAEQHMYSTVAEVILEPQGESFLITTSGLIYDVTVNLGYWDYNGIRFTPEITVFYADAMTPDNALMIKTFIPDVLPTIQISYTSGDQRITVYLSQSGEDGSALLLN